MPLSICPKCKGAGCVFCDLEGTVCAKCDGTGFAGLLDFCDGCDGTGRRDDGSFDPRVTAAMEKRRAAARWQEE